MLSLASLVFSFYMWLEGERPILPGPRVLDFLSRMHAQFRSDLMKTWWMIRLRHVITCLHEKPSVEKKGFFLSFFIRCHDVSRGWDVICPPLPSRTLDVPMPIYTYIYICMYVYTYVYTIHTYMSMVLYIYIYIYLYMVLCIERRHEFPGYFTCGRLKKGQSLWHLFTYSWWLYICLYAYEDLTTIWGLQGHFFFFTLTCTWASRSLSLWTPAPWSSPSASTPGVYVAISFLPYQGSSRRVRPFFFHLRRARLRLYQSVNQCLVYGHPFVRIDSYLSLFYSTCLYSRETRSSNDAMMLSHYAIVSWLPCHACSLLFLRTSLNKKDISFLMSFLDEKRHFLLSLMRS